MFSRRGEETINYQLSTFISYLWVVCSVSGNARNRGNDYRGFDTWFCQVYKKKNAPFKIQSTSSDVLQRTTTMRILNYIGEDPRTAIPSLSRNDLVFLGPGATRRVWVGLKIEI